MLPQPVIPLLFALAAPLNDRCPAGVELDESVVDVGSLSSRQVIEAELPLVLEPLSGFNVFAPGSLGGVRELRAGGERGKVCVQRNCMLWRAIVVFTWHPLC